MFNPKPASEIIIGDYLITASRFESYQLFKALLKVRELQQTTKISAQQYAGLGGCLWEGPPGEGKSDFARKMLLAHGFTKGERYRS